MNKRKIIEVEQKALEINLDDKIYGTFAEIGAGQEVARNFFTVGAAAGTIAKTMSAYDKIYSDRIYGVEDSGRYVCESRLYKMLDHEFELMTERLNDHRPNTHFFAFADTVSAINYHRTNIGHGWMGIRFQHEPTAAPSDIVLHVRLHDKNNGLQQSAVGILGVNLVYSAFKYETAEDIVVSLMDQLQDRVKIDMVRVEGPAFEHIDNRLISLLLVKHGLTDVAMFNAEKKNLHASEFLYKKNVLVVRGSYRPATHVNIDMHESAKKQFLADPEIDPKKTFVLSEITLDNLKKDSEEIDEQDFIDRTEVMCHLGHTVVISNCEDHHKLIDYLADFKVQNLGIVLGVRPLLDKINEKYEQNQSGRLIAAFGELFNATVKVFVYPSRQEGSNELMNAHNIPIPEGITFLFKHLLESKQIEDIEGFNAEHLGIYSKEVLRLLRADEEGWDKNVPAEVADVIRDKCLFGFPCETMQFKY